MSNFSNLIYKHTELAAGNAIDGRPLPKVERRSSGYLPRKLQQYLHANLKRFNVLVCHRRFGKTVFAVNEMIDKGLRNTLHNPQYAYIAPTYKQAKMIVWDYLVDYCKEIPGMEVNKSDLTVSIHRQGVKNADGTWLKKPDRIKFMLLGADNPDSLRGLFLDGAVLDEFAQQDPIIWGQIIRPALADRKGWAIFIGTPKGQNHFFHRFKKAESNPSWFTAVFKASETGILDDEEIEEMRADMEPDEIEQELECSFTAAILGSYYGHILNSMRREKTPRIGSVPYNNLFPVDTFWDIGMSDSTGIWFRQSVAGSWHYIDYYEASGEGMEHYINMIKDKPYRYGKHVWPHDGKVKEWGSGLTRIEQAEKFGIRIEIQKRQAVDDRIQATRLRLQGPTLIDAINCARGLEGLANYQKEWDSKLMMFKNKPKHDWSSHASDSFGYSCLDDKPSRFSNYRNELPQMADGGYNELD